MCLEAGGWRDEEAGETAKSDFSRELALRYSQTCWFSARGAVQAVSERRLVVRPRGGL